MRQIFSSCWWEKTADPMKCKFRHSKWSY